MAQDENHGDLDDDRRKVPDDRQAVPDNDGRDKLHGQAGWIALLLDTLLWVGILKLLIDACFDPSSPFYSRTLNRFATTESLSLVLVVVTLFILVGASVAFAFKLGRSRADRLSPTPTGSNADESDVGRVNGKGEKGLRPRTKVLVAVAAIYAVALFTLFIGNQLGVLTGLSAVANLYLAWPLWVIAMLLPTILVAARYAVGDDGGSGQADREFRRHPTPLGQRIADYARRWMKANGIGAALVLTVALALSGTVFFAKVLPPILDLPFVLSPEEVSVQEAHVAERTDYPITSHDMVTTTTYVATCHGADGRDYTFNVTSASVDGIRAVRVLPFSGTVVEPVYDTGTRR